MMDYVIEGKNPILKLDNFHINMSYNYFEDILLQYRLLKKRKRVSASHGVLFTILTLLSDLYGQVQ